MKHLFLTGVFAPPLEGGSVVYVHNVISRMPPDDVLLYTCSRIGSSAFDQTQAYRILRSRHSWSNFSKLARLRVIISWLPNLVVVMLKEKPQILHACDFMIAGIVAYLLGKLFDRPYILYSYGEELSIQIHRQRAGGAKVKGWLYSKLIKNASGLIAISDYTIGLLEMFGAERVRICKVLPTVAPSKSGSPTSLESARKRYGLSHEDRIVLSVGRLIERKGHDSLIRSMRKVLESVNNAKLIIVGQGPFLESLTRVANEAGVSKHTIFAGLVDDETLTSLYELCSVFALTHRQLVQDGDTEGFGMVFVEANAHGKPVIGGRAGGVKDAILDGVTGLILDADDLESISEAITRLLVSTELSMKMGENGRLRVLRDLSPASAAQKMMAFSERVVSSRVGLRKNAHA